MKFRFAILILVLTTHCTSRQHNTDLIQEFVFGGFCSECRGICAPMFRLSNTNNDRKLSADLEDNFWRGRDNLQFKTDLSEDKKIKVATDLLERLPKEILNSEKDLDTLGCPDCTDGCGVYIEFTKTTGETKQFYIDLEESEEISKEVDNYVEYLYSALYEKLK